MVDIARLGAAECLASGITTVADASFSGAAAVACAELGLRAIVCLEAFGTAPEAVLAMVDEKRERIAGSLSERVQLGVSPHAPYTVSLDAYKALVGLGLPVATHLNESPAEVEWLLHGTGPMELFRELLVAPAGTTGIRLLAEHGLLGPNVVAAHCVVVDEEEIGLLAAHRAGVAHCPRSNGVLGCGIAPVEKLLDAGIAVGIGTDSPASTPSFDMFDEMRAAVLYARLRTQRPDTMPAAKALELATLGSARALGLDDRIGSLESGKLADVTVVDLEGSPFLPWEDPAAAVVYGGATTRVLMTLVGGKVRFERDRFEWRELRQSGIRARDKLLGR